MFDFAWSEIAVIAAVALIVIGPKDLPRVLRAVGKWVGKARVVAREFQSSVDQMIREAELEEIRETVNQVTKIDLDETIEKTVDPGSELQQALAPPATDGTTQSAGEAVATAPPRQEAEGAEPEAVPAREQATVPLLDITRQETEGAKPEAVPARERATGVKSPTAA